MLLIEQQKKMLLVVRIIISAGLLCAAYLQPNTLGWAIFCWWAPLWGVRRAASFGYGVLWGVVFYGGFFWWVYHLMCEKTCVHWILGFFAYVAWIGYFALTSGVWFEICSCVRGWLVLPVSFLYYYFVSNMSIFFIARMGLPFFNPLIPIIHYNWVARLVAWFGHVMSIVCMGNAFVIPAVNVQHLQIVHIPPMIASHDSLHTFAHRAYHRMCDEAAIFSCGDCIRLFVAPESFCPFLLEQDHDVYDLWKTALPPSALFLCGTVVHRNGKSYQAAALLQQRLINLFYVKNHAVPFVEKIPKKWRRHAWIRSLFLPDNQLMHKGKRFLDQPGFVCDHYVYGVPLICSEFFFRYQARRWWHHYERYGNGLSTVIVLLVNDSWFSSYFREILQRIARIQALYSQTTFVYVGHYACYIYGPIP